MTEIKKINNCKEKIFSEIKNQHLEIRPKWVFEVIRAAWKSILVLLLMFFGIIGVLLHFYAKNNHLVSILGDYDKSIAKFLIFHFPFELVFVILLVILSVNLIGKRLEISYKVRPIYWYAGVFLSAMVIMFVSELAGFYEIVERFHAPESDVWVKSYINKRLGNMDEHLFDGEVISRDKSIILIKTRINNQWSTSSFDGDANYALREGERVYVFGNIEQNQLIIEKVFKQ